MAQGHIYILLTSTHIHDQTYTHFVGWSDRAESVCMHSFEQRAAYPSHSGKYDLTLTQPLLTERQWVS